MLLPFSLPTIVVSIIFQGGEPWFKTGLSELSGRLEESYPPEAILLKKKKDIILSPLLGVNKNGPIKPLKRETSLGKAVSETLENSICPPVVLVHSDVIL